MAASGTARVLITGTAASLAQAMLDNPKTVTRIKEEAPAVIPMPYGFGMHDLFPRTEIYDLAPYFLKVCRRIRGRRSASQRARSRRRK